MTATNGSLAPGLLPRLGLRAGRSSAAAAAAPSIVPQGCTEAVGRVAAAFKLLVLALALAGGLASAGGGAVAGLWWALQNAGGR